MLTVDVLMQSLPRVTDSAARVPVHDQHSATVSTVETLRCFLRVPRGDALMVSMVRFFPGYTPTSSTKHDLRPRASV